MKIFFVFAFIVSLICLVSGCSTMNKEDIGTLAGGAVGGLLGSQLGGGFGGMAASMGGAVGGAYLGNQMGQRLDELDKLKIQDALVHPKLHPKVLWQNKHAHYSIRPLKTLYTRKQPCREYITTITINGKIQKAHGHACRQLDGSWRILSEKHT